MSLSLYDTMAREKRLFEPRDPSRVTMYVCGPTVYNYSHIGNFRPVIVFDVLFRLLRTLGNARFLLLCGAVTVITRYVIVNVIPLPGAYVQGAFFGACLQVDFQRGIGENNGPHIAAIGYQAWCFAKITLAL